MGPLAALSGGRMPVFHYLHEDEAADVYLYLTEYPPEVSPEHNSSDVTRARVVPAATTGSPRGPNTPRPGGDGVGITTSIVFSLATAFTFEEVKN